MLSAAEIGRALGDGYRLTAAEGGVVNLELLSEGGRVVGRGQLRDHQNLVALRDLEVVAQERGQGIGTRALADILRWADAAGHAITLRARHGMQRDPDHDRRLAAWLSRHGFETAGGITMVRPARGGVQ